jgi:hypothetical protein
MNFNFNFKDKAAAPAGSIRFITNACDLHHAAKFGESMGFLVPQREGVAGTLGWSANENLDPSPFRVREALTYPTLVPRQWHFLALTRKSGPVTFETVPLPPKIT